MTPWYAVSSLVHLLALALWLGGIAFFLVVFGPAVHELKPGAGIRILNQGRIAFEALSWVGITLVMITGMTNLILRNQMSGAYLGQYYMIVLTIKLFAFIAMLVHHSLQIFKYGPKIVALTAEVSDEAPSWPEPLRSYWQRWFLLLKINAALGPIAILLGLALVRS
jgi:putative copper export protein